MVLALSINPGIGLSHECDDAEWVWYRSQADADWSDEFTVYVNLSLCAWWTALVSSPIRLLFSDLSDVLNKDGQKRTVNSAIIADADAIIAKPSGTKVDADQDQAVT